MFDLSAPNFPVKLDIEVKQALTLQVAGVQGGFTQTEMLSLDQQSHEEEVKQLQQQVHIVNSLSESSEDFFFSADVVLSLSQCY